MAATIISAGTTACRPGSPSNDRVPVPRPGAVGSTREHGRRRRRDRLRQGQPGDRADLRRRAEPACSKITIGRSSRPASADSEHRLRLPPTSSERRSTSGNMTRRRWSRRLRQRCVPLKPLLKRSAALPSRLTGGAPRGRRQLDIRDLAAGTSYLPVGGGRAVFGGGTLPRKATARYAARRSRPDGLVLARLVKDAAGTALHHPGPVTPSRRQGL